MRLQIEEKDIPGEQDEVNYAAYGDRVFVTQTLI